MGNSGAPEFQKKIESLLAPALPNEALIKASIKESMLKKYYELFIESQVKVKVESKPFLRCAYEKKASILFKALASCLKYPDYLLSVLLNCILSEAIIYEKTLGIRLNREGSEAIAILVNIWNAAEQAGILKEVRLIVNGKMLEES